MRLRLFRVVLGQQIDKAQLARMDLLHGCIKHTALLHRRFRRNRLGQSGGIGEELALFS